MSFEHIIDYVDYYYLASRLPSVLHPTLMSRFLTKNQYGDGNTIGLTDKIFRTSLRLTYEESPYTDGKKFYYPLKYFYNEFFEKRGYTKSENVKLAIAMFNGIAIHEASHCRIIDDYCETLPSWTLREYKTKAEAFNKIYFNYAFSYLKETVDDNNPDDRKKIALMSLCTNLVEDIFIEHHFIPSRYSWAEKFLKYATEIFFDRFSFEQNHEKGNPITAYDVYYLRSTDNVFVSELISNFEIISKANDVFLKLNSRSTLNERAIISAQLYEIFKEDMEANPENYQDSKFDEMMNALMEELAKLLQKIVSGEVSQEDVDNILKGMGSPSEGEGKDGEVTKYGDFKESDKENIDKELDEQERWTYDEFQKQESLAIWNKTAVIKDVFDKHFDRKESRSSSVDKKSKVQYLPALKSLANVFKYAKHGKVRTQRHLSDGILDDANLHNFRDGNIFRGVKQERHARNKPQVVIMVDVSGSTNSFNGDKIPLFHSEFNLAYSMQKLLIQSGVPCSCYSHTTYYNSDEREYSSEIAGIHSFDMPFLDSNRKMTSSKIEDRYGKALISSGLCGNADGYALRYAAEQFDFTAKQSKILIMISDGLPAESTWQGYSPEQELKESIRLVREKGIVVLAFASVEKVVSDLIPLYGEKFVVKAFGNNADKEASKILDAMIGAY